MRLKKIKPKKVLSLVLSCALISSLITPVAFAAVKKVMPPDGKVLISQTDHKLAKGVTESDVFLNEASGNAQIAGYMLTVESGSQATFKASYRNYYTDGRSESTAERIMQKT